jgi:hypothetical protein
MQGYRVATLATFEHSKLAYVAVGKRTRPSVWYVKTEVEQAFAFTENQGREVVASLNGEHTGADPRLHVWARPGEAALDHQRGAL